NKSQCRVISVRIERVDDVFRQCIMTLPFWCVRGSNSLRSLPHMVIISLLGLFPAQYFIPNTRLRSSKFCFESTLRSATCRSFAPKTAGLRKLGEPIENLLGNRSLQVARKASPSPPRVN